MTLPKPVILAFLQNQWFKDPARVRELYDRQPDKRNEYIRHFLFMGCLTGRRIVQAFGDDFCQNQVIWEEVSPQIGGHAASSFPADTAHIIAAIEKHQPKIIMAFGKIACEALSQLAATPFETRLRPPFRQIIYGPHPAARHVAVRQQLDEMSASAVKGLRLCTSNT